MTFWKIAWRNLKKRPIHTGILMLAIATGVFSLIIYLAFIDGFTHLMINTVIDTSVGHIQIHRKNFLLKRDVKMVIPDTAEVVEKVRNTSGIKAYSPRIRCQCLISSPEKSISGSLYGINPELEDGVTIIQEKIIRGEKLKKGDKRGIFISEELAEKLKVDIADKVVVMAQDVHGDMNGAAYRVRGTFKTSSKDFDTANVFITHSAASDLLGVRDNVHEIAIKLQNSKQLEEAVNNLKNELHATNENNGAILRVKTWKELEPGLAAHVEWAGSMNFIMFITIYIALAFGIVNAFMMEIFDRIKEFGIMTALGTRPGQVFRILLYESILLGVLGSIAGVIMSFLIVDLILNNSFYLGEGMEYMGLAESIPLFITTRAVIKCFFGTTLAVILATLYPAAKAASFRPVEALRYV